MDSETPPKKKKPATCQCFRPTLFGIFTIVLPPTLFTAYLLIYYYNYVFDAKYFRALQKQGEGISKPQIFFMNEHILHDMTLVNQQFLSEK